MALTRDFKQTIVERVQRDPEFAKAMLDEAATLFLNGEPDMDNLAAILGAVRRNLNVGIEVRSVEVSS